MRISKVIFCTGVIGLALGLSPTLSLDGTPSPNVPMGSPVDAFRVGTEALQSGESTRAITALQYAAEHGHGFALWQLGRMYAEGKGVARDDVRAFEYFRKFADSHADDSPAIPRSRFVANAFVALGEYYLDGIPQASLQSNPDLARRMFHHAASYFGDPEAQYRLARLYITGVGVDRDARRAVPWLLLAARKGHFKSQAELGRILFWGEPGMRQRASGLMWLTIACDGPGGAVTSNVELREKAMREANDDERTLALMLLERWVQGRRE